MTNYIILKVRRKPLLFVGQSAHRDINHSKSCYVRRFPPYFRGVSEGVEAGQGGGGRGVSYIKVFAPPVLRGKEGMRNGGECQRQSLV